MKLLVVAEFDACGAIKGFHDDSNTTYHFRVLENDTLVASVTTEAGPMVVQNCLLSQDLFESTAERKVYTCRFELAKFEMETKSVTIIQCAARLVPNEPIQGRWNDLGLLGGAGGCDREFSLHLQQESIPEAKMLHAHESSSSQSLPEATAVCSAKSTTESLPETVSTALVSSRGSAVLLLPGVYIFGGEAKDQLGTKYVALIVLEVHPDSQVSGQTIEGGRKCPFNGSILADGSIKFGLAYPANDTTMYFNYTGKIQCLEDGTKHIVGSWEVEKNENDCKTELWGSFGYELYRSTTDGGDTTERTMQLTSGSYTFVGQATSDGGTSYDSTLRLNLLPDGTLVGQSDERSIAPQQCKLSGTWSRHRLEYNLRYTNGGTAHYQYVGFMVGETLIGRWSNDNLSETCLDECGPFEFKLQTAPQDPKQPSRANE